MDTKDRKSLFLAEILSGTPIPIGKLSYFEARLRSELHQLVLGEFLRQRDETGLTHADLAQRIHRTTSQIDKLLGASGDWTIGDVGDLLLAMKMRLVVTLAPIESS